MRTHPIKGFKCALFIVKAMIIKSYDYGRHIVSIVLLILKPAPPGLEWVGALNIGKIFRK
jgi:hypothetical protein